MKNSKKLMSCLLSLSIIISSQVSTSALHNIESCNSQYNFQKISKVESHTDSKSNSNLLTKFKKFIIYPASLLVPPGILALIFGGKVIHNYLHSEKPLNLHDKIDSQQTPFSIDQNRLEKEKQEKFERERQERLERERQERLEREEQERLERKKQEDAEDKANKIGQKLRECVEINNKRNALVSITGPTIIIGDLHGDRNSIALVRDQVEKFLSESESNNAVFLGDYFNKKSECYDKSFEVLDTITNLQVKYKNRVVLLRGNHEESYNDDFNKFKYFGQFTFGTSKYSVNAKMIDEKLKEKTNSATIKDFCNSLPIAAEVTNNGKKVLCLHGFIPSDEDYSWLNTLKNNKSSEISSEIKFPLLCNFYSETSENKTIDRGINTVECVCSDTLKKFLNINSYKCLVRGHSHNAFSKNNIFGDGSCYSVHSNPADFYKCGSPDPTAGILLFDNNGEIKTKIEYTLHNTTDYNDDKLSSLFEVPNRKDEVNKFVKENLDNDKHAIAVSPDTFKKIVKDYRGALIFRGCTFENEEAARGYENILFESIEEAISTNHSPRGFGQFSVYFAYNLYRALKYSLDNTDQQHPIMRIYLAYLLDDTITDYSDDISVAKRTSENIIFCNEPFMFKNIDENGEKIFKGYLSGITIGKFRETYSNLEKMVKEWVTKCIGENNTENLWSYLSDDIKIQA